MKDREENKKAKESSCKNTRTKEEKETIKAKFW